MIDRRQMTSRDLQFDLSSDDQALFLAEVDELVQRVEESLVDLERAPDDEALLKALDVLKLLRDEVETRVAADVDVEAAASAVERRAALRTPGHKSRAAKRARKSEETAAATHRFR